MFIEEVITEKFGKCLIMNNGIVSLAVTLDFGPRIICYKINGKENIFGEIGKVDAMNNEFGDFYCYGGHRFWHAPEIAPRNSIPDNEPVGYEYNGESSVTFVPPVETPTGMQKVIKVTMCDKTSAVEVEHILINKNMWEINTAPWALTIVKAGGRLIIPNEPFKPHTEYLLPARPLVLWYYTDMSDSRFTWGKKFTIVRNDACLESAQKIGVADKQGWAAYELNNQVFLKKFGYVEGESYPDEGCNLETFTRGTFHEFETLSYLRKLNPGESCSYIENWHLYDNISLGDSEDEIESQLNKLL